MAFEVPNNLSGDINDLDINKVLEQYKEELEAAHEAEFYEDNLEKAKKIYFILSEKVDNKKMSGIFEKKVRSLSEKEENNHKESPFKIYDPINKKCGLPPPGKCFHNRKEPSEKCIVCPEYKTEVISDSTKMPEKHLPGGIG